MTTSGIALRFTIAWLIVLVSMTPLSVDAAVGETGRARTAAESNVMLKDDDDDEPDEVEAEDPPETEEIDATETPEEDNSGSGSGNSGKGSSGSDDSGDDNSDDSSDDSSSDDDSGGSSDDSSDDSGNDSSDDSPGGDGSGSSDDDLVSDDEIDGETVTIVDSDGDDATDGFRAGQAVVHLQPGASIDDFNARHGTTLISAIADHDLYLIELPVDVSLEEAERDLSNDPDTRWSELNYVNQAPEGRPGYSFVSGAPGANDPTLYAPELLGYEAAQVCGSGEGITVAVLDSGIDASHPALQGRVSVDGWNALNDTADVRDVGNGIDDDGDGLVDEMVGHGTHVAGIVAQVAPGVTILPVKVLSSDGVGDAFFVAAGIHYAVDHGADVINLSLSSTYDARVVAEAVAEASEDGVVVVAAAGNNSTDRILEFPAADTGVMGVAATDRSDIKGDFSNYGDKIDLSAPGVEITSAMPGGLYATWSGTSMAAPFVAAAAALVAAAHPSWTAQQISNRLTKTSGDLDEANPDFAGDLGAGRLDIEAAVGCKANQSAGLSSPGN